jgi:hypothetical protein
MRGAPRYAVPGPSDLGVPKNTSVETAVDWAEVAAMLGDYREAVSWLVYVEWLQGKLPPELAELRERWERGSQPSAA